MSNRSWIRMAGSLSPLVVFAVLTVLPWRYYGSIRPSFDPASINFAQHHTTAWTDSPWWQATAVLGLVAAAAVLRRTRRTAVVGVVAAGSALSSWTLRAWQVHHPDRATLTPTTVAIAHFTAGPEVGSVRHGQGLASWLAAALLILLLAVSVIRLAGIGVHEVFGDSRMVVIPAAPLLVALAGLTFLPWYRYRAFDIATRTSHLGATNAWTTFEIRDYWRVAGALGVIGAVALLLRHRFAPVVSLVAGITAAGCWGAGTWQLHHPVRSGAYVVAQVITPADPSSVTQFASTAPMTSGRTFASTLALCALVLVVILALLRLIPLRRRTGRTSRE